MTIAKITDTPEFAELRRDANETCKRRPRRTEPYTRDDALRGTATVDQAKLAEQGKVVKALLTHSGRLVEVGDRHPSYPSLTDIGLSLSRMPRFGGHARRWWTVLDHSLYCEQLARKVAEREGFDGPQSNALRLYALLHDAAEAITGDIPTHWKTDDMRLRQGYLDCRIARAYLPMGTYIFGAFKPEIKEIDHDALIAEAYEVGPPHLSRLDRVQAYFGSVPKAIALTTLRTMIEEGVVAVDPIALRDGVEHPQVQRFTGLYLELR